MNDTPLGNAADEILGKCNIVDIIAPVVPLKKTGANYKACCPFHKEKTPSFVVSEAKQIFHCFGCGASGNAIGFVMKYYNLSFPEAVEKLAAQYGVEIRRREGEYASKLPAYYEINKTAARFFFDAMRRGKNPGADYMAGRGMKPETMRAFGIGYADSEWHSLSDELKNRGADMKMAEELGLLRSSEKGGGAYDYFRGRVIFPIIDTRRRVIAFGGRIIEKGEPKYLNSKESPAFHKGRNLFGLNLTKGEIQKAGFVFLVEGYMDVVGLYQSGVRNTAASLGTALTPDQAKLLKRYTGKVIICYDSDSAGIKAAIRGIDVLRPLGFEIRVMNVTGAKDPDEFAAKFGRDAFLKLADESSKSDVDYKIDMAKAKYDLRDTEEAIKFYRAAARVLRGLPAVESELYTKKIARECGISEGALRRETESGKEMSPAKTSAPERNADEKSGREAPKGDEAGLLLEKTLLRLAFLKSEFFEAFRDYPEGVVSEAGSEIVKAMASSRKENTDFDTDALCEILSDKARSYANAIQREIQLGDSEAAYADCLKKLSINRMEKRAGEILDVLSIAGEGEDTDGLMAEFSDIQRKLKQLKG